MSDLISKEELAALGLNQDEDEENEPAPGFQFVARPAQERKPLLVPPAAKRTEAILSQAEIDALLARLQSE